MSEPILNDLGVTAEAVDLVEDAVLAEAQAQAAAAAKDDFEQTVSLLDTQISELSKEERTIEAKQTGRRKPALLSAVRKRLDHARTRRQRLLDARLERERLALGESAREPTAIPDDKPASGESERDFLIRTGKLTPFQGKHGYERDQTKNKLTRRRVSNLPDFPSNQERKTSIEDDVDVESLQIAPQPSSAPPNSSSPTRPTPNSRKRRRVAFDLQKESYGDLKSDDDEENDMSEDADNDSDEDFVPDSSDLQKNVVPSKKKRSALNKGRVQGQATLSESDGGSGSNQTGLPANHDLNDPVNGQLDGPEGDEFVVEEQEEVEFDGGLRMPASIFDRLFPYQRTGVSFSLFLGLLCQPPPFRF